MKFDQKIKDILLEMPHIGFNTNSKMIQFDFKIEKFQRNHNGFLNYVKSFMFKTLKDDHEREEFIKEISSNNQLGLSLKKSYPEIYGDLVPEAAIKKFIQQVNL